MAIHIKEKNKGVFTAWAKAHNKSVAGAASMILKNKDKYSSTLVKRANFARNARKFKHEDGGLVEYGDGGTIAGIGGAMSMIPTPWTQIGGAALSLIGGIVGNKEQEKEQNLARQQELKGQYGAAQSMANNPYAQIFANGGVISGIEPNVEVEGGEVLQGRDKSLAKVEGPKHAQGGIPLFMENGGRVFSDKIVNPKTGRTFAEDAEILMKQLR